MSVQIIVDSTVDMPERMKDRFRIVPLTVHFGAEEFIDGVTIDKHRFYERLVESDELPTTSQASPAAFDAIFSDVASVGDSAVVVTLASKFSGTYQSACIAAAEYDNIYVVDSKSAAIGSGIQVIGKARGSKQGNNLLVQKIHESGGIDFDEPIILGYSGLSDSYLKKYVEDSRDIWQDKVDSLDSTLICSVIGTHTGPGVVAVAFFKKG